MALTKVPSNLDSVTATTQSASDNSTNVATTAYVTTAIANLVDGAPSTLNTLNEIAAALNDDAALNTTLTNSIATKAPLASPTFTSNINGGDGVELRLGDSQDILFKHHSSGYGHLENKTGTLYMDSETFTIRTDIDDLGTALSIDASQNITTGGNIYLTGSNDRRIKLSDSGISGVSDSNNTVHVRGDNDTLKLNAAGNGHIIFEENGSERMRIQTSTGYVGIGTVSPSGGLHVVSQGDGLVLSRSGYDTYSLQHSAGAGVAIYNMSDSRSEMYFDGGGNVGIGTTSPGSKLHVNGKIRFSSTGTDSNRWNVYWNGSTGDLIVVNPSSDVRLKENFDYNIPGIETVKKLKPVKFSWKDGKIYSTSTTGKTRQYGFIAQETMEADSLLAHHDEEKDTWNIEQYESFTAVLTKAIQEQQTIIEDLKSRIETLEG